MVYSRKILSSEATFINKFLLPEFVASIFAVTTILLWVNRDSLAWLFLFVTIAAWTTVIRYFLPLKYVEISGEYLIISNYFKEIQIEISHIKNIEYAGDFGHKPIRITFDKETEFRDNIIFMPERHLTHEEEHPAYSYLKVIQKSKVNRVR